MQINELHPIENDVIKGNKSLTWRPLFHTPTGTAQYNGPVEEAPPSTGSRSTYRRTSSYRRYQRPSQRSTSNRYPLWILPDLDLSRRIAMDMLRWFFFVPRFFMSKKHSSPSFTLFLFFKWRKQEKIAVWPYHGARANDTQRRREEAAQRQQMVTHTNNGITIQKPVRNTTIIGTDIDTKIRDNTEV